MVWGRKVLRPSGIVPIIAIAGITAAISGSSRAQSATNEGTSPAPAVAAEMVLLSGGEFSMGKDGYGDYSPVHRVRLAPFHIDKREVTNSEYQKFCEATGRALPFFWGIDRFCSGPGFPQYPKGLACSRATGTATVVLGRHYA